MSFVQSPAVYLEVVSLTYAYTHTIIYGMSLDTIIYFMSLDIPFSLTDMR